MYYILAYILQVTHPFLTTASPDVKVQTHIKLDYIYKHHICSVDEYVEGKHQALCKVPCHFARISNLPKAHYNELAHFYKPNKPFDQTINNFLISVKLYGILTIKIF